jgi:hypothetical protein
VLKLDVASFFPSIHSCFYEFYGPQRVLAERVRGLRRAFLPRAGFAFTAGFSVRLWNVYARRSLAAGVAVGVMARQRGRDGGAYAAVRIVFPAA